MTAIRGQVEITQNTMIGFNCGLCHRDFKFYQYSQIEKYKSAFGSEYDCSSWKTSNRGQLRFDHPDGEGDVNVDLCSDCFYKLRDIVKEMGGKIENDG